MNSKCLIFLLYDSITNSVFESQVLEPLVQHKKKHGIDVRIITYEQKQLPAHLLKKIRQLDIELYIIKRGPFICKELLYKEINQCANLLERYPQLEIKARGPIAGYIALQSLAQLHDATLTIQARGLLAEEYGYVYQDRAFPFNLLVAIRKLCYLSIEQYVYKTKHPRVMIESVSQALKDYLVEKFHGDKQKIEIAHEDLPNKISPEMRLKNKISLRKLFTIAQDAYVYVYCGSAKKWQCPEKMLSFFVQEYHNNPNAFLLIISQDIKTFEQLIQTVNIPKTNYTILALEHTEVIDHLCMADCGLLFRQPHIINWVSRPTKLLEYQAVGLKLVHNDTIAELTAR